MVSKKPIELLIAHARTNPNPEALEAEAMFRTFMSGGFSYEDISHHPDSPVYASAEVLAAILPLIIDEMFAREDTGNFLIYPVITAVDPLGGGHTSAAERTEELERLVDQRTVDKIIKLLTAIQVDPPVPVERLDRIITFWKSRGRTAD